MEIINFHAHVYPKKVAAKAVENLHEKYQLTIENDGTVECLFKECAACGISRVVILPVATSPVQVSHINDFVLNLSEENNGKSIPFMSLHPHMDLQEAEREINRCMALGAKGIKLHPDMQGFKADDPRVFELYEIIQGHLPLLIHCGDFRIDYSHPRRIAHIIDAFPKLDIVAAHFGGWTLWDYAKEYLLNRKCMLDTSSSFEWLGPQRSKELIREYGAERFLFGTDYPLSTAAKELEFMKNLNLTDREYELIYAENAIRYLNL
ncbi:MAG: amidohydrolase family protein [Acutalibacteraceae bacterium]